LPARVRWAVHLLDPRPEDQILEVGGGSGLAAALICERLTAGRLLMIDRSAVAVGRAAQRNAIHLASGRLVVAQSAPAALTVPPGFAITGRGATGVVPRQHRPGPLTVGSLTRSTALGDAVTAISRAAGPGSRGGMLNAV